MADTNTTTQTTQETDPMFSQIEGELKTRFELLPTELQQVITSSDYQMKLFEVAKKYKITYEKLGQLELETTMVMLGMTPPDEFKLDLSEQLKLDEATINNIVRDINDQIFTPIRETLMALYSKEEVEYGETFAKDTGTTTPINTPTPVASTPTNSPYREPIGPISSTPTPPPTPGLNKSAVPTLDKNDFDSRKEVGLNPALNTQRSTQINPVTIGLSSTPVQPVQMPVQNTAPASQTTAPARDPYRELPDMTMPGMTTPAEIKATPGATLSPDFLKKIPTLAPSTQSPTSAPETNSYAIAKELGAFSTMKDAQKDGQLGTKLPEAPHTQSEALKNIADLKNSLAPKKAPIAPAPEVPQQSMTTQQPTPVPPGPAIVGREEITLKTPQHQPLPQETSELLRNIKLQVDAGDFAHRADTTTDPATMARRQTMEKIDAMIDFKKAGNFMPTKNEALTPPAPQAQPGTPGRIYESDFDATEDRQAKKSGFFAKMKNFLGGSKKNEVVTSNPAMTQSMPMYNTAMMPQNHEIVPPPMPLQNTVPQAMPAAPVDDAAVAEAKILDERSVPKPM